MHHLLLLFTLLVTVQVVHAIEVDVPSSWTHLEVPSERPKSIKSMVRVLAPDGNAEVSINDMEILMSLDEAAESFVRGAAKRGFKHSSTSTVEYKEHEGRHITGILPLPDGGGDLPIEAYIIRTPDSMMTASVIGLDASSKINEVLGWIKLPVGGTTTAAKVEVANVGRSLWEYLGIGVVFAAVVYAIINSKSRKKQKGEQADAGNRASRGA
ncbi:MAG: hypothetical protein QM680_13140 [Luteolibacter sp.]